MDEVQRLQSYEEMEKMIESATLRHTDTHWVFILSNGAKYSVGKYVVKTIKGVEYPEGVKTEEEAIEIMTNSFLAPFQEVEDGEV